jgi:hypothetical protein
VESKPWPFPILPPEQQTNDYREQVAFLESAYAEGLGPCSNGSDFEISGPSGRTALIVYRGHWRRGSPTRWEIFLGPEAEGGAEEPLNLETP